MRIVVLCAGALAFTMACSGSGPADASDLSLRQRVTAELGSDPSLSFAAKNVDVSVSAGTVTLSGSVASDVDRDSVEGAIGRVPGTVGVIDTLSVSAARDRDDGESDRRIASSIRSDLEPQVASRIGIVVRHGLVTLTGSVPHEQDVARIVRLADATPGVAATDNEIDSP